MGANCGEWWAKRWVPVLVCSLTAGLVLSYSAGVRAGTFMDSGLRALESAAGTVLFADDFSDGAANGWREVLGNWAVVGQAFQGLGGDQNNDMLTVTGSSSWANYTLSARMMMLPLNGGFNDFGLVFYAQEREHLRFTLGSEAAPPTARITHRVYDPEEGYYAVAELATVVSEPKMVSGKWYNVSVVLDHDRVSAFVDGLLVAHAEHLPFSQGYIGLSADDPTVVFDDIVVTVPGGNVPVGTTSWLPMFGVSLTCQDSVFDLYLYNRDSGELRTVKQNCNRMYASGGMDESGQRIVYAEKVGSLPTFSIMLYDVGTKRSTILKTVLGSDPAACFDRDNMVLFADSDGTIKRMDVQGEQVSTVVRPEDPHRLGMFWLAPDRRKLVAIEGECGSDYATSNYENLVLFNADGSGRRVLVTKYLGEWNQVSWKPDSTGLFYYHHTFNGLPKPSQTKTPRYLTFDLTRDPIVRTDLSGSALGSKDENVCLYTRSGNLLGILTGRLYDANGTLGADCSAEVTVSRGGLIGADSSGRLYCADRDGQHFHEFADKADQSVKSVNYCDYVLPAKYGTRTFQWTYGRGGEWISAALGPLTVSYGDGSWLTAFEVTNASFSQNRYWNESGFSDGVTTGLVTLGEYCLSTDPFLTSYPRQWSLGKITNGMRIDMSPTYLVRRDGTQPGIPLEGRVSLYTIQDVNVLYGHCADAVVLWNLDARYSYVPLNFFGKDADLGLTLPTQSDTAGHAVISFRIRALHTDIVAMGGVDPQTGQLLYLGELKEIKTP